MAENDNKRKYKRFPIELSARYQRDKEKEWKGCTVTDIGRGGLGIIVYLKEAIPVPSSLQLEIVLPKKDKPIKASGTLSWLKELGKEHNFMGGIEFTQIDPEDKWELLDLAFDEWTGKSK